MTSDTENAPAANSPQQLTVNAQYIKDLSFENPDAPASLMAPKTTPKIELTVNLTATALQENMYEVVLHIGAKAIGDNKPLFLVDLQYAGIFTLNAALDEQKGPILLIYCPSLLFPFARRIIADTTRDGGFPPLMLDPIDFNTLYQTRSKDESSDKQSLH